MIGFGAQGRAHALNLRDSGISVIVGLYPGSKSRVRARRSGLEVLDTAGAVRRADIIFLALSDTQMPAIYAEQIAPGMRSGQTLLFAHGFAIYYRTIVPRKDIDVVMVAPKGLGPMVRPEFVRGRGAPGLIAIHQESGEFDGTIEVKRDRRRSHRRRLNLHCDARTEARHPNG